MRDLREVCLGLKIKVEHHADADLVKRKREMDCD